MKLPRVYPILDTESLDRCGVAMETAAAAFLEGGAGILQIRHKGHWSRDVLRHGAPGGPPVPRKRHAAHRRRSRRLRPAAGSGLHVGQDDLSPRDARKLIGSEATLGYSSHNMAQLVAAGGEPVDYVAIGPIFATVSKRNPDPVVGIEEIRRCRSLIEKPLVAIGGITLENAARSGRPAPTRSRLSARSCPTHQPLAPYASAWKNGARSVPASCGQRQKLCHKIFEYTLNT